ncbi:hypothetical protein BpHYR1_050334, partial [Brachionus plicatilis]
HYVVQSLLNPILLCLGKLREVGGVGRLSWFFSIRVPPLYELEQTDEFGGRLVPILGVPGCQVTHTQKFVTRSSLRTAYYLLEEDPRKALFHCLVI